jgi:hypothetical protein
MAVLDTSTSVPGRIDTNVSVDPFYVAKPTIDNGVSVAEVRIHMEELVVVLPF